jgi:hydroxyethylthiazole kinase-like uncharacterized protein yjeF
MARADALAIAGGIPGIVLMEAAGRAVARAVARRFRPCPTLVLAGPGNNGGDGYVAARLLEQAGWPVTVSALAPPGAGSDAALAAAGWRGPMAPFGPAAVARAALVIDAVFGAGLARDIDGPAAEALRACAGRPVVAIDVPSGIDGATGQVRGVAPQAAATVTFFRLKPGHLLLPGRTLCGEVVLADIGLPASVLGTVRPRALRNGPGATWRLPEHGPAAHKYTRGHLTILGGAAMTGATRLAAAAARRAEAGLVTIAAPDGASAAVYRGAEPGTIVTEDSVDALLGDPRRGAWIVGPGLPPDASTRAALRRLVEAGRAVVADAGAVVACAGTPEALRGCAVLTPHEGEFARVFGPVGGDKPAAARRAAALIGAAALLKGPDTVVAAPDGRVAINDNAPPSLATAGSGDVLAGVIGALLAQGMPPFEAACAGAWLQGASATAAAVQQPRGLVAEDLINLLPVALSAAHGVCPSRPVALYFTP